MDLVVVILGHLSAIMTDVQSVQSITGSLYHCITFESARASFSSFISLHFKGQLQRKFFTSINEFWLCQITIYVIKSLSEIN